MKISALDQSPAAEGSSQHLAIRESIELAKLCDRLGYHRYWVSEHHNSDSIVGTAPEILMAAIAATTKNIRIGSAGVMLPHYSALKVAEQFRVLEGIAPGRIDLGVGRAPSSDRKTAFALNPHQNAAEEFPQQVQDLQAWVSGKPLEAGHAFGDIKAHPLGPTSPEMWILGSSDYGAQLAAYLGDARSRHATAFLFINCGRVWACRNFRLIGSRLYARRNLSGWSQHHAGSCAIDCAMDCTIAASQQDSARPLELL